MTDEQEIKEMNLVKGSAWLALKQERMHGTDLVVQKNGKIEFLTPDEFEKNLSKAGK